MRYLDRQWVLILLKQIESRKDELYEFWQKYFFKQYGYFPEWDLGELYAKDPYLYGRYTIIENILKKYPVDK